MSDGPAVKKYRAILAAEKAKKEAAKKKPATKPAAKGKSLAERMRSRTKDIDAAVDGKKRR